MEKITLVNTPLNEDTIKTKIYTIRNQQVMIDSDLALLYGVTTKRLNEQVKRNFERFPTSFRFQLTQEEYENLRLQIATSSLNNSLRSQFATLKNKRGEHTKYLPYVFTEQGVSMLSAVLKSPTAINTSIKIIESFVNMRKFLSSNNELFQKIESLEKKQLSYEIKSDEKFEKIFKAIEEKSIKPKQGIFYEGQVYDAYIFISDLIKNAQKSIILIDNYVDDSILTILSKRKENVTATIYTNEINKQLELDIKKHNMQYPKIEIKKFTLSHNRFLIIDDKEIFHIGASLKDLGKKWFAFSRLDVNSFELLSKLKKN